MWVMTSWGILMPGLRPPETVKPGDPRTLQIRARRKKDIEILRELYMGDTLGPTIQIPGTDYQFRAYCTPEAWGDALAKIGRDIDYVKFKETTETKFGDKKLHHVYLQIWSLLFNAFSSKEHQDAYWAREIGYAWDKPRRRGNKRRPFCDDDGFGSDPDDVDWYDERLDHQYCSHPDTAKARRQCSQKKK